MPYNLSSASRKINRYNDLKAKGKCCYCGRHPAVIKDGKRLAGCGECREKRKKMKKKKFYKKQIR